LSYFAYEVRGMFFATARLARKKVPPSYEESHAAFLRFLVGA
jgi:hypothetical protein